MWIYIMVDSGRPLRELLEERTKAQLQQLARSQSLTGHSGLSKDELIKFLLHQPPEVHTALRAELSVPAWRVICEATHQWIHKLGRIWQHYNSDIYGLASIIGMLLALLGLLFLTK